MKTLPENSKMRYEYPISRGCLAYFPAAIAGVARHSYIGGAKYNNGELLHLRFVSTEHLDCVGRHLLDLQDMLAARDRGVQTVSAMIYDFEKKQEVSLCVPIEEAILIECNALAWRALAISQEMHEKFGGKPLAPAARLEPPNPPTIKLLDYERDKKVKLVVALRNMYELGLKEALDIVHAAPTTINHTGRLSVDEARKILTTAGATVA